MFKRRMVVVSLVSLVLLVSSGSNRPGNDRWLRDANGQARHTMSILRLVLHRTGILNA